MEEDMFHLTLQSARGQKQFPLEREHYSCEQFDAHGNFLEGKQFFAVFPLLQSRCSDLYRLQSSQ